jgi:hypothetical protein
VSTCSIRSTSSKKSARRLRGMTYSASSVGWVKYSIPHAHRTGGRAVAGNPDTSR